MARGKGDDPLVGNEGQSVGRRTVIIGAVAATFGIASAANADEGKTTSGTTVSGNDATDEATAASKLFAQAGDRFQIFKGASRGKILRPELLTAGERPVEAFPFDPTHNVVRKKNRLNRVLVLRLPPDELEEDTRLRSVEGILAYSALCTHRACTIKAWKAEERHMLCYCHLSEFAALSGGNVVAGPARRQLPMIPLGIDAEGFVVAKAGFTGKPGGAKK